MVYYIYFGPPYYCSVLMGGGAVRVYLLSTTLLSLLKLQTVRGFTVVLAARSVQDVSFWSLQRCCAKRRDVWVIVDVPYLACEGLGFGVRVKGRVRLVHEIYESTTKSTMGDSYAKF